MTGGPDFQLSKSTFTFGWVPDFPKCWYYDSDRRILHAHGCTICGNYVMHIANHTMDEFYRRAIEERDADFRKRYSEGYRAGSIAPKVQDKKRYRSKLKNARAQISILETGLDKTKKARVQLEAAMDAFEIAFNEPKDRDLFSRKRDFDRSIPDDDNDSCSNDDDNDDDNYDYHYDDDEEGEYQDEDDHDGDGVEDEDENDGDEESVDKDEGEEDYGCGGLSSEGNSSKEEEKDDCSRFPGDSITEEEEGDDCNCLEGGSSIEDDSEDDDSEEPPTYHSLNRFSFPSFSAVNGSLFAERQQVTNNLPHRQSDHVPTSTSRFNATSSSDLDSSSASAAALEEIRIPGRQEVLAEIKSLVSEAHSTSRWQRTDVQNVLLSEWRHPSPSSSYKFPAHPATDVSSRREDIDVYVDASETGICFYSEGRWQAWRLKVGWKEAKIRDVQWAEAVAVEMGIRLLLADLASGYKEKKIRLYSDNRQVVGAILAEDFDHIQVGPIVRIYHDICHLHRLDCTIEWIRGSENPADAPSRFSSLKERQRFPRDVVIPPHLQEFVLPYLSM